jgi:HAE1 family hydrophobic/amphiphilic exporter-1/multidrug efflux pump
MSPRTFIERPVLATVISVLIVLVGTLAMRSLPIAMFPRIIPPSIQVTGTYPGASAEVVAQSVAGPIEQQMSGINRLLYFTSANTSDGQMSMTLTFGIGTDVNLAAVDTQNQVSLAEVKLPDEVKRQGITIKKKSSDSLCLIALESKDPRYDRTFLSNYANINITDTLRRIPGVGDASVFGSSDYTMRLILNPQRMAQLGVTPSDVVQAVREQNATFPAGRVGGEPSPPGTETSMTLVTQGRFTEVEQFENVIVRSSPDGAAIRVRDIATTELGAQSYDMESLINGQPTALIMVSLAADGNALDVMDAVEKAMARLAPSFPQGVTWRVPHDSTEFIRVSIDEVIETLMEAMILVFIVVFVFLGNWRATLIPCLAVPVALIGTFAGMSLMGFTINTLSLFGMVLAIGIVVDDAIVVVENVERIMLQEGLSPFDAAKKAMEEVTGPVIAIVLVLCSVFVPVAFLGGITGQIYKQFAITIAISVVLSGIVALTLSPALCALLLRPPGQHHGPKWFVAFNKVFDAFTRRYTAGLDRFLGRSFAGVAVFLLLLALTFGLFRRVPSSFIPDEDQGYLVAAVQLPDAASKQRTDVVLRHTERILKAIPEIRDIVTLNGQNFIFNSRGVNSATMYITLSPWEERRRPEQSAASLITRIRKEFSAINEAIVVVFNPPPISGLSTTGGFTLQVQNNAGLPLKEFASRVQGFLQKARSRPELTGVSSPIRVNVPQINIALDREKAKTLNVAVSNVFETIQAFFGTLYVNDFNKFGRIYRVQAEGNPAFRASQSNIDQIYVRSATGTMVPLSTLTTTDTVTGPDVVFNFNGFNTALVIGSPAPGYSSGQALDVLEQLAETDLLPQGLGFEWSGTSLQERQSSGQSGMVFAFGILVVFLVLAAQYESWTLPFAVMLCVPLGIFGAIAAVWLRDIHNDVYFQIGLVTLVGLAAKNAILIVEYATQLVKEGKSVAEAAREAARLRFRPILMTSFAFILGVVPLVKASGAGAHSRHSIGTGVMGGMLAATFLAVFFVPLFFSLIHRKSAKQTGLEQGGEAGAAK